ncbi:hypothetical protein CGMCC3_g7388 [Colletotrichum fructicola]|nr:uncharacterized protein CGMCC3_g7388 [Colletotrichum fructicola]KAE9576455.1 hypothetical protein CGMCC3_g7388 [Colletotrichum fructicola]
MAELDTYQGYCAYTNAKTSYREREHEHEPAMTRSLGRR